MNAGRATPTPQTKGKKAPVRVPQPSRHRQTGSIARSVQTDWKQNISVESNPTRASFPQFPPFSRQFGQNRPRVDSLGETFGPEGPLGGRRGPFAGDWSPATNPGSKRRNRSWLNSTQFWVIPSQAHLAHLHDRQTKSKGLNFSHTAMPARRRSLRNFSDTVPVRLARSLRL
jgi:hypothetical protein